MNWMKVLYSLQFLVFVAAPFLYRSARPSMMVFYYRMSRHCAWRRLYVQVLVLFLVTFHFLHLQLTGEHYDVLVSSALTFALISQRIADRLLRGLQHMPAFALATVFTIGVAIVPHMLPLAVTSAVILFGSVFYPSRLAGKASFRSLPDFYFRWEEPAEPAQALNPGPGHSSSLGTPRLLSCKMLSCYRDQTYASRLGSTCDLDIEDAEVLEYVGDTGAASSISYSPIATSSAKASPTPAMGCVCGKPLIGVTGMAPQSVSEPPEPLSPAGVDGSPPHAERRDEDPQKPAALVGGKPNTPILALPNRERAPSSSKLGGFPPVLGDKNDGA